MGLSSPTHPQVPTEREFWFPDELPMEPLPPFSVESVHAFALAEQALRHVHTEHVNLNGLLDLDPRAISRFKLEGKLFSHPLKSMLGRPRPDLEIVMEIWVEQAKCELALFTKIRREGPAIQTIASRDDLVAILCMINGELTDNGGNLRVVSVGVHAEELRNITHYPSAKTVLNNLERLLVMLAWYPRRTNAERTYLAVASYIAIVHAHPFPDGNGRTARTFYALLMSELLGTEGFPLIRLASRLSEGTYILSTRAALFGDRMTDLLVVMRDVTLLSDWLCRMAKD